jgi:hypothetical protein
MGDNRKTCNKNCDNACKDLKLENKRKWKNIQFPKRFFRISDDGQGQETQ